MEEHSRQATEIIQRVVVAAAGGIIAAHRLHSIPMATEYGIEAVPLHLM
jgi:hypothetical protein